MYRANLTLYPLPPKHDKVCQPKICMDKTRTGRRLERLSKIPPGLLAQLTIGSACVNLSGKVLDATWDSGIVVC